jgi:hypothetical protein
MAPGTVPEEDRPEVSAVLNLEVGPEEQFKARTRVLPAEVLTSIAGLLPVDEHPEPLVSTAGFHEIVDRPDDLCAAVTVDQSALMEHDEILEQRDGKVVGRPARFEIGGMRVRFVGGDGVAQSKVGPDVPEGPGRVVEDLGIVRIGNPPGENPRKNAKKMGTQRTAAIGRTSSSPEARVPTAKRSASSPRPRNVRSRRRGIIQY